MSTVSRVEHLMMSVCFRLKQVVPIWVPEVKLIFLFMSLQYHLLNVNFVKNPQLINVTEDRH